MENFLISKETAQSIVSMAGFCKAQFMILSGRECALIGSVTQAVIEVPGMESPTPIGIMVADLSAFSGSLPEGANIQVEALSESKLKLSYKRQRAEVSCIKDSTASFFAPNFGEYVSVKVSDPKFAEISKYLSMLDVSDQRFYARGIGCSDGSLVITNGVALMAIESEIQFKNILPKEFVLQALRMEDSTLRISGGENLYAKIESEGITVYGSMIVGSMPPFKRAVPTEINFTSSCESKSLSSLVKTAEAYSSKNSVIELRFKEGQIEVVGEVSGSKGFSGIVDAQCSNEFKVLCHGSYLRLACLMNNECDFRFESAERPFFCNNLLIVPCRF